MDVISIHLYDLFGYKYNNKLLFIYNLVISILNWSHFRSLSVSDCTKRSTFPWTVFLLYSHEHGVLPLTFMTMVPIKSDTNLSLFEGNKHCLVTIKTSKNNPPIPKPQHKCNDKYMCQQHIQ